MNSILPEMTDLSKNKNGAFLIEKLVNYFSISSLKRIAKTILTVARFLELSKDQFGIIVVKKFMERFKGDGRAALDMALQISTHFKDLIEDPYGNYIIQHSIEVFHPAQIYSILENILK